MKEVLINIALNEDKQLHPIEIFEIDVCLLTINPSEGLVTEREYSF